VRLSVLYLKSSVCDRTGVERAGVVSMHQSGTFRIPPKLRSTAMSTVRTGGYSLGARFRYVCASVQTGTAVLAAGFVCWRSVFEQSSATQLVPLDKPHRSIQDTTVFQQAEPSNWTA